MWEGINGVLYILTKSYRKA